MFSKLFFLQLHMQSLLLYLLFTIFTYNTLYKKRKKENFLILITVKRKIEKKKSQRNS